MGNNPGKEGDEHLAGSKRPKQNELQASEGNASDNEKIPMDLFMKFTNCLRDMVFEINEDLFQKLANLLEVVTFNKDEVILEKGRDAKGVFLVVNGHCKVVSENDICIATLEDEDYFGEISSFYKRKCSANVKAGEDDTKLLLLPSSSFDGFMQRPVDYPLMDFYVKRKYLDFENTPMEDKIIKEITKLAITNAPPFHNWSTDAIEAVVNSILPENIVFYPAGADVFFIDDVDSNGYLLIRGSVEIFNKSQKSFEVFNAGPNSLWFGDEQLFCKTKRKITAKAHSPCIVATLSPSSFKLITESYPVESSLLMNLSSHWKKMIQCQDSQIQESGQCSMEIMRLMLRKTELFQLAPSGMIYNLCLEIRWNKFNQGEDILKNRDRTEVIFIVLSGCVIVESKIDGVTVKYEQGSIWYSVDNETSDVEIKANKESVVGILSKEIMRKTQNLYPDAIINW